VGSTLALAHPLYYDRLVQLASTIKFLHQLQIGMVFSCEDLIMKFQIGMVFSCEDLVMKFQLW
jgi:hypothetical protein